jgi:hypothetical protein
MMTVADAVVLKHAAELKIMAALNFHWPQACQCVLWTTTPSQR